MVKKRGISSTACVWYFVNADLSEQVLSGPMMEQAREVTSNSHIISEGLISVFVVSVNWDISLSIRI